MFRAAFTIGRLTPVVLLNAVALFGMSLAACLPCVARAGDAEHAVADDPASNVIVLDSAGGFRAAPGGGADDFVLCVKADGTASIRTRTPGKRQTWRMPPEEMNDLLRFLLDEQKFFALKPRVGGANPAAGMQADAGGWVLSITADGKTHTVRGPMGAGRGAAELKRFQRCILRLQGVMAIVEVGGGESMDRFLKEANAVFSKEWPAEKPLTIADIASGTSLANGSVYVIFVRGSKTIQASSPALDGPVTGTIVSR
jgi:hypothetical protein